MLTGERNELYNEEERSQQPEFGLGQRHGDTDCKILDASFKQSLKVKVVGLIHAFFCFFFVATFSYFNGIFIRKNVKNEMDGVD